tara:strand:+ start:54467 stop:54859 length:393 start_codon:yes stop_codon:yes gene_type:complete
MNKEICYSLNGEEFYKDIDLIDFSDFEVGEEVTVEVAEMHPYYPHQQAFANVVVELMTSNTFDDLGEDTAVDWCNDVDSLDTQSLQKDLENVLRQWLMDNKCATVLWRIGQKVDEITVVVTEDGFVVEGE